MADIDVAIKKLEDAIKDLESFSKSKGKELMRDIKKLQERAKRLFNKSKSG